MKKSFLALILGFSTLLTGCVGVRFADVGLNKNLPDDFKKRNLFDRTDVWKYNLSELAGSVIYKFPDEEAYRRTNRRHLVQGYEPPVRTKELKTLYHSKIDQKASAEGSYLAFAANFSNEQLADILIEDTAEVFIPFDKVPQDKLIQERDMAKQDPRIRRYYVQGVLLASITLRNYTKTDADASGAVGDHVGAKASVYRADDELAQDFKISLELIDIDQVGKIGAESTAKPRGLLIKDLKDPK